MSALATALGESYVPALEHQNRTFLWSVERGLRVNGDRELIAQATVNLLENAQRHTPETTIVRLTAVAAGDRVCVRVTDAGPGIPRCYHARVTKRFGRLDASRNTTGHGLGLSLASAVARLHGGRLILKDGNSGLVAIIDLPQLRGNFATSEPATVEA